MTNEQVEKYLKPLAQMSYRASRDGSHNGDAYVLCCQIDELVAEIERLRGEIEPRESRNEDYARIDAAQLQKNRNGDA